MNTANPTSNQGRFAPDGRPLTPNLYGQLTPERKISYNKAMAIGTALVLAATGSAFVFGKNSSKDAPKPVPTLKQVSEGSTAAGLGLNQATPTLTEGQVSRWPARETVTATTKQAADGVSAIAAAVDPEVFSGPQSNDATRQAIEDNLDAQTRYGQGNVQPGETFDVADIHPTEPNVVTGGNPDIPAK